MQVIFYGGLLDQKLVVILKYEERNVLRMGCRKIETTVMELFNGFGWSSTKRIEI
jgi:hypothetical protein